ncbi:hypothetical protein NQZ68_008312, partial [Dissostichus eleginoides]
MMKRMMRARVQIYSQPPAFMMRDRELSRWKNQLNWHIQGQGRVLPLTKQQFGCNWLRHVWQAKSPLSSLAPNRGLPC